MSTLIELLLELMPAWHGCPGRSKKGRPTSHTVKLVALVGLMLLCVIAGAAASSASNKFVAFAGLAVVGVLCSRAFHALDEADTRDQLTRIEIPLKGRRGQQVGDMAVGFLAVITQYFLAGVLLAVAVWPSSYNLQPTTGGRVLALFFAAIIFAFGFWGRRRMKQGSRFDARLVVTPEYLIVSHGGLLEGPVTIPRGLVRVAATDDGSPPSNGQHRFAAPRRDGSSTWLWPGGPASLPMLDPMVRAPNLLLLFTQPVEFPARHRSQLPVRRLPQAEEAGLLLRVNEPAAAERAFGSWGVVRPLLPEDLALVDAHRKRPLRTTHSPTSP